jgi:hypothetical protein
MKLIGKKGQKSKNFNVEELENRLEMATIQGAATTGTNAAGTNNGCKANKSCTQDNW